MIFCLCIQEKSNSHSIPNSPVSRNFGPHLKVQSLFSSRWVKVNFIVPKFTFLCSEVSSKSSDWLKAAFSMSDACWMSSTSCSSMVAKSPGQTANFHVHWIWFLGIFLLVMYHYSQFLIAKSHFRLVLVQSWCWLLYSLQKATHFRPHKMPSTGFELAACARGRGRAGSRRFRQLS